MEKGVVPHNTNQAEQEPVLVIDPSALDFYFEAVLPEIPEVTRKGMRAAIMRGLAAEIKAAEVRAYHKLKVNLFPEWSGVSNPSYTHMVTHDEVEQIIAILTGEQPK
jgi:hypothetical protein